jgi:hypothetical protein
VALLYSILPPEVVFQEDPDGATAARGLREVVLGASGVRLLLRRTPTGECVERVISSDPRHFLHPDLQPGSPYRPELRL